ncbi:hypothetical protein [Streptomyces violascens]|uniref:hypothetical protein n=1 Tax=Streptomyces violascens TaxID=67381 RepID=UPI0036D0A162
MLLCTGAAVVLFLPAALTGGLTLPHCLTAFTVLVPVGYFVKLLRRTGLGDRGRSGIRAYA